jgi:hypothetical protein
MSTTLPTSVMIFGGIGENRCCPDEPTNTWAPCMTVNRHQVTVWVGEVRTW